MTSDCYTAVGQYSHGCNGKNKMMVSLKICEKRLIKQKQFNMKKICIFAKPLKHLFHVFIE